MVASRNALELTPLAPHKAPDIAVARSGHVFITANVHDLAYRLVDNLGNPAPAANTAITLQRGNGPPITKRGADTIPDFFPSTGGLQWSYDQHGEGWAVFYQLPEDLAYMVTVTFDGTPVGEATVDKLTHTIMEDLVLRIYKVKLTFVDCVDSPLSREAFVKVIPPSPATPYVTQLDSTGALDFGYLAGGEYTIDGVWWKGVWVKFTEARIGDRSLSLNPDGSLTFTVDSNIDSPIKLTALINDFIFTTWDFNQDNKIPRLNITLTWVGVHPLTGSRLYFLETMDPTGDTNPVKFNTTKSVSQFLSYRIDHFYGGKSTSRGLKTYADVRYVFYKMPSTFYNITVTTVTTGDPETEQTPGNSKWPGRTVPVDYEIKIDWTGHSSPPSIRKTPAGTVNDRVVLRVYMTMGGQFVTDPSLNPIGNATLYTTCGPVRIDLLTWAHTFYQRIVDGDFDYLNEARRIGNATYHIVNDNGVQMEMYIPEDGVFSTLFVSKWTEDTLLTTWLKADSQHSSNIWWNGSYRKQDLTFYSYVYPLEFTRGEQPWARFYDRVGLTGTGTLTTEDGPMDHDNDPEVTPNSFLINRFFNPSAPRRDNATWPRHNFTVVGNEGLWNQQRWRWEQAVADGLVPEVPTRPYSLVFEKEVVTVPIPVGFITLSLKDEDLARPIPYAVVELSIYTRTSNTDPSGVRYFSAVYKTGRDGNLTLLYPTQEMVENIVSPNAVKNFTLTVFWYLNSSIVYKDAFNLTKRGYSVDKVAIADVTFVLAISADKDRPVQDLYARIWWLNVTEPVAARQTVFPGRITVDTARRTWTYTAVPETRGAAKWTTGQLTLPWLPASERFTKSDHDLVFDAAAGRWTYSSVTRTWDIPYPSNDDGSMLAGWPYSPKPSPYYRFLTYLENYRIQYRISVWSDQLPIDPSSQDYNNGAWQRDHYELVWRIPAEFPFAWMLFGHPPFDITFYRGSTGVGGFTPIPGYALTRTWTATPSPGSKVVAIKLNATDVDIPVFWQVGDLELGTYDCGPLLGYIVKGRIVPPAGATFGPRTIDAVTTAGTITVGDKTVDVCIAGKPVGLVTVTSGDTPSTVIWGGSSLVIDEVSPPPSIWYNDGTGQAGADNPNRGTTSNYWRNWVSQAIDPITGQPVNLHVGDQLQVPGVDLGIQYMGYGRPYEGVSRVATVEVFSNDPDNRAHRPFIKMFEFQNVSARITDFNGRPLPGAFYQLIDSQTGKSAAWSYAGPDGRIVPMPIRKPGGVFIQRVLYLGQGANGEPTWPVNSFARWPIAYDSRDDETTQETQKPDIPLGFAYTAEAGPWPTGDGWVQADVCRHAGDGSYNYTTSVLEALASCPPAGWGRSFDVITRIFDLRVRFVYGDAQRPADPAYVFSAPSLALSDDFIIRGQGAIFEAKRLARSSYDIVALWPDANGEEVGRRTFDISTTNVGTVEGTVVLALRDVSFNVVDRQGRPLSGARVSVSPDLVRDEDIQLRPDSIFTILRIPDGRTYDFTVEWTSPFGTTARAAVRDTPAGLQSRGSITLPVDDVTLTVVDFDGRPVAGAAIRFAGQDVGTTDSQGIIIIGQVPLDNEYQIEVAKDGTTIGGDRVRFTASRTSATIQAGVYDITVLVKGAAGQPIQGAIVELQRGGTTVATAATDASGSAVFSKVVGADYSVKASYEQFSSSANVARGTRSATLVLDLYTVILGVPMTLATFLALIIGLILLVIVIVVIVSEYIRWRGRRLGIYPAAPPKK
ncbi:MAG: carboxypeptidase-like regulatory domain-containing protein [Candidatus Caldarchaeum sp.]